MKDLSTDQPEVLGMSIQFIIVRICCSLVYVRHSDTPEAFVHLS
jgi:hypothetical protein